MDKIPEQKREKLLKQLDNYCGVSGENFDSKKCEKLIEETYKYSPEGKTKFDQGRQHFKTIEMQNIRQNQYNGGLLSDLAYRNKEDLNIETLQRKLQTLNTNDKNDERIEIENIIYLINTLKQK